MKPARFLKKQRHCWRMMIAGLLIPGILLSGAAGTVSAATPAADLNTVSERLRAYYLTVDFFGDGAVVEPCTVSRAGDYLASQNRDGSWSDVDYTCTESAANGLPWSPYLALDRMQAMAVAYAKPGHPYYHDDAMLAGVERALLHWKSVPGDPGKPGAEGPYSVNWWENGVGPQLRFGRIGLFLKDELSAEALAVLTKKLDPNGDNGTGQNSLWFSQTALFRALIVEDTGKFAQIAKQMDGKMAVQTGAETKEALQVDGSYHGHGELFMSHNYGMALFRDMSLWAHALHDTVYALSDETIQTLADYMLNGTRWTLRGDVMELACGYTPCGQGGYAYNYYVVPIKRMMVLDEKNRDTYQVLLDNIEGRRADNGLSGFHYMWTSAYASQMREGYGVNVRMDSKTIKGSEWRANWGDGPDYGNLVFWTTAGACNVVIDGDEYTSIYPTFDWRHTPGSTAPFNLSSRTGHDIARDAAMGVDSGDYGATGFTYVKNDGYGSTMGTVGYFFFEEEYVALGAGIASNSQSPVHTTLNQTKAVNPATAAGAVASGTNDATATGKWVYNNKIGYVFPDETTVHLSSLDQSTLNLPTLWNDSYSQFSIDNVVLDGNYEVTDDTFSLWIDHGVRPSGASYAYIVVPNRTAQETAAYAADNPITILANTETVQAVRHEGLHQTQINFYKPGAVQLDADTVLVANAPCSVVVDTSGETVELTAGIPNNATDHTLTLSMSTADGVKTTDFVFAPAPYTGESMTLTAGESAVYGGVRAAFDGDAATTATVAAGESLIRDFGHSIYLSGCSVTWDGAAAAWRLEGSEDGHNWTLLGNGEAAASTMALDAFFRYVRFIPQSDATVADIAFTVRDLDYANRANRALRRPVTVSGTHADTVAKEYAVDGKTDTRWASNRNGDMWIAVDLGEEIDVDVVRVSWELAYAETYTVDLSSDGKNWTTALTVHNTGGVQQHLLPEGARARYVRIHSLKALNQYGINIWELEVYSREDATTPEIAELKSLNDACEALDTTGLSETVAATLEAALTQSAAALQLPYNAAAVQAAAAALKPAAESARRELAAARLQALCEKAAETGRGYASDMAWQFFNRQKTASEQLLANAAATADALEAQANWLDTALNVLADSAEPSKALLGDVNGDGVVNTTDARLALQHAVEKISLNEAQLAAGDVDGDGIVNTTDARLILQYAVEKIDTFPVGK